MNSGKYVFAQLLQFVDRYEFDKCVARYNGDFRTRGFNCWNQFIQLFFGQLTSRHSLRDICVCKVQQLKGGAYPLDVKLNYHVALLIEQYQSDLSAQLKAVNKLYGVV